MSTAKACIVGAGSSGLPCAKVLNQRGIPFDCFEKGSGVGGNWRYGNDNGVSSAYESLHINTSKRHMAYSDYPMPEDFPDYPHHSQILTYFESYTDHFGLRDAIRFRTEVTRVEPAPEGGWRVTVKGRDGDETSDTYGAVLVANGHHWKPHRPDFPGRFDGTELHSHDYKTPDLLRGKRVLVIGVGNSGCDIACESARYAERTWLSTRRGAHVLPKYVLGRPLDDWNHPAISYLPLPLQRVFVQPLLYLARGAQKAYGFPTPNHPLGAEHPTISADLLNLVGHGKIAVKPDLAERRGGHVAFEDGSEEEVDVIVYATGYEIAFPFLSRELIDPDGNELPLYHRVAHPELPGLYFIGLLQPLGATMPLAEAQGEWVADLLAGEAGLPGAEEMRRVLAKEREAVRRRYVGSRRHTIQVDFYPYLRTVARERRRGRRRPKGQALDALTRVPASHGGAPVTSAAAPVT